MRDEELKDTEISSQPGAPIIKSETEPFPQTGKPIIPPTDLKDDKRLPSSESKLFDVKIYFKGIGAAIISQIKKYDSVHVCCPWFTSPRILEAIQGKKDCSLITHCDEGEGKMAQLIERLHSSFSFIYVWKHKTDKHALMHNKFIIFFKNGEPVSVWTGSYNMTVTAENNKENGIYISSREIAKVYETEFIKICGESDLVHPRVYIPESTGLYGHEG